MSDFSLVHDLLFWIVILTSFWPGIEDARSVDRPKKGYWTVATVFWPIRKAYHDLWPHHAVLERAARGPHALAALLTTVIFVLGIFNPAFVKAIPPGWIMVEVAVVAFLLGRTSGFWSADRRIMAAQQADEAAEAETGARSPTSPGAD
jgi:hypothetical protein